ncbi:MAG TPA: cysteine desulfurase family protein [Soehngenia sp.]|nr:cysteine desulfurase family protein [Soehngenia sp.]
MIYLDNCSTTRPRKEVIETVNNCMLYDFGNPSSLHKLGLNAEKILNNARENIASFLCCRDNEIYFTSGGTESNNIVLQGAIKAKKRNGKHIITTKLEHPSVLNVIKTYEKEGYEVTYLSNDEYGRINISELEESIREDTILISIIHINNEIGTVQDIKRISKIIKTKNPNIHFHVDGVQSFGKLNISVKDLGMDSFSFSAHKIHGPKGIGGLYLREKSRIEPIIFGGNQEKSLRSGTENIPAIAGFSKAVDITRTNLSKEQAEVESIKTKFADYFLKNISDVKINSPLDETGSSYILSVSFKDVRGEVLLHMLEDEDIYISTGSACSSKSNKKSHVLKAIGLNDNFIEGTIRLCFSYENIYDDIDFALEKINKFVKDIRKITRR